MGLADNNKIEIEHQNLYVSAAKWTNLVFNSLYSDGREEGQFGPREVKMKKNNKTGEMELLPPVQQTEWNSIMRGGKDWESIFQYELNERRKELNIIIK